MVVARVCVDRAQLWELRLVCSGSRAREQLGQLAVTTSVEQDAADTDGAGHTVHAGHPVRPMDQVADHRGEELVVHLGSEVRGLHCGDRGAAGQGGLHVDVTLRDEVTQDTVDRRGDLVRAALGHEEGALRGEPGGGQVVTRLGTRCGVPNEVGIGHGALLCVGHMGTLNRNQLAFADGVDSAVLF